jgi:hypothetical protein
MKIFISSVRRGLEEERDALPGLILALGHTPLRFEDFTAMSVPSREACLRGVADSDAYLLLLGPDYGEPLPETGKSPSHEEYVAALAKGIPRLVFRKLGAAFDEHQTAFAQEIEAYATGVFRDTFANAVDLQPKVVAALANLPEADSVLRWSPLSRPVTVEWRETWPEHPHDRSTMQPIVEIHAVPTVPTPVSARRLRELVGELPGRVRSLGVVGDAQPIHADANTTAVWAVPENPPTRGGFDAVRPGALAGVRINAGGQRSAWSTLSSDGLGSLLDSEDLTRRVANILRLLGNILPGAVGAHALAIGLSTTFQVGVGSQSQLGSRSSAALNPSDRAIHVDPDEEVTATAFDTGADEAAQVLSQALIDAFRHRTNR